MSNSLPFSVGLSLITAGPTLIFTAEAVRALADNKAIPTVQQVLWSPLNTSVLLRNMGTKVFVFDRVSRLKKYEFRRVQLINGASTEGVGTVDTGYVCVWAASGSAPSVLS